MRTETNSIFRPVVILIAGVCLTTLSGCALFLMANKAISGDPMIDCAFKLATDVDLTEGEKKLLVVSTTPAAVESTHGSLDLDLLDGVTGRLKLKGVKLVDHNKVATWLDDNGGAWSGPDELAEEFDADYIVHIDISNFSFLEENSPDLYRGRCAGVITVYEVAKDEDDPEFVRAYDRLSREFNSVYPSNAPMSTQAMGEKAFRKRFSDRICAEAARMFYDYHASELVE